MSAAWPIWNNDNPLPGRPPRAWVPIVIQNTGEPVPSVAVPGRSLLDIGRPARQRHWLLGPVASLLIHGSVLAAGLFLFLPADDTLDIEGSAVEVEIIATQTVESNAVSEIESDATQSMVSAGGEVIEASQSETLEPVEAEATPTSAEAVEPIEAEPVEPARQEAEPVTAAVAEPVEPVETLAAETVPLLASNSVVAEAIDAVTPDTPVTIAPEDIAPPPSQEIAQPTEVAETIEATEPVDPNAPPVPQTRTVAQKQEPTYPKAVETPRKPQPQKPKPSVGGNGGNSNADAVASAASAGQKGTGAQGNSASVTKYPGQVLSRLRRALRYPSGGRGRGEVQVQFTVSAGGSASGIRVVSSSGNPVFDKAAIETVQRAAPFPAIPPESGKSEWTFTMPLGFVR